MYVVQQICAHDVIRYKYMICMISFVRGAEWYIHVEVRRRGRDRVGIGGGEKWKADM